MRRMQIQIDESLYEAIRRKAFGRRQSMAFTIREMLRASVESPSPTKRRLTLKDFKFIGAGHGGRGAGPRKRMTNSWAKVDGSFCGYLRRYGPA